MPFPPPPATAFSRTGNPSSSAAASASSGPATRSVPGTSGTPASRTSAFARALAPIRSTTANGDLSPVRDEDAVEHRRSLVRQRCGERAGAAAQHGLAVRDEDAHHRKLQERRERLAQVVVRRLPEPTLRTQPQRRTRVARLRAGAEEDVAEGDRALPW